jgi:hypothetical protein
LLYPLIAEEMLRWTFEGLIFCVLFSFFALFLPIQPVPPPLLSNLYQTIYSQLIIQDMEQV